VTSWSRRSVPRGSTTGYHRRPTSTTRRKPPDPATWLNADVGRDRRTDPGRQSAKG